MQACVARAEWNNEEKCGRRDTVPRNLGFACADWVAPCMSCRKCCPFPHLLRFAQGQLQLDPRPEDRVGHCFRPLAGNNKKRFSRCSFSFLISFRLSLVISLRFPALLSGFFIGWIFAFFFSTPSLRFSLYKYRADQAEGPSNWIGGTCGQPRLSRARCLQPINCNWICNKTNGDRASSEVF